MTPKKICVYAIAKNESENVQRWVDSMSEADYVVVLDTGSTDDTVAQLRARGVTVEIKEITPWRFDDARNESMKLIPADTDICISTDLDETLTPGWAKILRDNWNDNFMVAQYEYIWSHEKDGSNKVKMIYQKIHKNDPKFNWFMPVHEWIRYEDRRVSELPVLELPPEFKLHHWQDENKDRTGYLDLLKISVEEDPNDFMRQFYYGRELFIQGHYKEAVQVLRETASHTQPYGDRGIAYLAQCYTLSGHAYHATNDFGSAEASYTMAINLTQKIREPYIILAKFLGDQQRYYAAIDVLSRGIMIPYTKGLYYEDENYYKDMPFQMLAILYSSIKQYDMALKAIDKALEFNPKNSLYLQQKQLILKELDKTEPSTPLGLIQHSLSHIEKAFNDLQTLKSSRRDKKEKLTKELIDVLDQVQRIYYDAEYVQFLLEKETKEHVQN